MSMKRVVIVGAGFGGVYSARALAAAARAGRVALTIVNRSNYFLFTPLLHEVATGGLGPLSITEPLREIFAGVPVRIVRGTVGSIDAGAKQVTLDDGAVIPYDILLLSTGATNDLSAIPGASVHAFPLKTLIDAWRIRERIIGAFDDAANEADDDRRAQMLSFAVVGGGATGVELVSELQDFAQAIACRYHRRSTIGPLVVRTTLLHGGPELLMQFPSALRKAALDRLTERGVDVRFLANVASVSDADVRLTDGSVVPANLTVWAAGVTAQTPSFTGATVPDLVQGRIGVDASLRATGVDGVYALGDAAHAVDAHGAPYPMLAQVAVAQADTVAKNILASLDGRPSRAFSYRSKGSLVSLGQWYAVGEIFSTHLRGRVAWWVWRTVYLFKFLSWRKRVRIAFEWTLHIFFPRDITGIDRM